MRVLHLISNFRWTERSEPAADMVVGQRALGVDAQLVCGRNRSQPDNSIEVQARNKGLDPILLEMTKHFRWREALRDIRSLRALQEREPADVFHSHLSNAHLLGAWSMRRAVPRPLLVHSIYDPNGPDESWRARWLARPFTDGWVVIGERARDRLVSIYGVDSERVLVCVPPVDVRRFAARPAEDPRTLFGLDADDFVVGVVARYAPKRRVDLLLQAVRLIKDECPRLRCLMVGRGDMDGVINGPARELGISDRIVLGGYCRWERLVAAYHAMNIFVYTAPGTDQSCRAVREALAAGVPVAACRTGYLPELIEDGVTGLLFDSTPEDVARALKQLYAQSETCARMGEQARQTAAARFAPDKQAEKVIRFYRRLGVA